MNKKILIGGLCCAMAFLFNSCTDQLEEKYTDPDRSTQINFPGFFTAMLKSDRLTPAYWNVRTFLLPQSATYCQTTYLTTGNSTYQQADGYSSDYWSDFYRPSDNASGPVATYKTMEISYNKLSDAEKKKQEIFIQAARVILYEQASQMVDLWGDIPFSESASLVANSAIVPPKFDDQKQLYTKFVNELKATSEFFAKVSIDPIFTKYDILFSGDAKKWQRYANSLRLRLLMRMSNVDENTSKVAILDMLNNPSVYPLIDGDNDVNYKPNFADALLQPMTDYTGSLVNALSEGNSNSAPDYMLNTVMNPVNDPRMAVIFDKNGTVDPTTKVFTPNLEYKALPVDATSDFAEKNRTKYAIVDSATFLLNRKLPGILITAPEINLIKAEAYERWGNTTDAKKAFETAVKQSVTFYYYLNGINSTGQVIVAKPADSEISAFVTRLSYGGTTDDKLSKIWTQKWLHFGFLQANQAWAEYRRTDCPKLTFPSVGKLSGYETPPTRLIYPTSEKSYNEVNYKAIQAKDTRTTRIFWDVK